MNYMIAYEPVANEHIGIVSLYNTDLGLKKRVYLDILEGWLKSGKIQVGNLSIKDNKIGVAGGYLRDYMIDGSDKLILAGYDSRLNTVNLVTQEGMVICDKVSNLFNGTRHETLLNRALLAGGDNPVLDTTDELSNTNQHTNAKGNIEESVKPRYCKYGRATGIYTGNEKEVYIPVICQGIGDDTFRNNISIEVVKIGGNIEYIGNRAFEGCINLREVRSNCQVKEIGDYVFKGCRSLEVVELFITTKMGKGVFDGCTKLREAGIIR